MISIVMPTYNREAYLANAIDSVLRQTYKDFELIVVDDGSTDGTELLMDYYTKQDPRIRYFNYGFNGGISFARNYGVGHAQGEYIAVMDSDDMMMDKRLKKSLTAIKNHDFVYSSYYVTDEHAVKPQSMHVPPKKVTFEDIKRNDSYPHVTIMAKRECFENNPYRFKVNDDSGLTFDFFKAGYKGKFIQEPLMVVRYHPKSTTNTKQKELDKVLKELDKEYEEWEQNLKI